jgi:hypothetical protein
MRARVIAVDPGRVFAVRTNGGITIMEIYGRGDVDVDDLVTGDFETLGGMTVRNETRKTDLSVFVQDFHCSAERVLQTYKLKCH